jgi:hypothetical protein
MQMYKYLSNIILQHPVALCRTGSLVYMQLWLLFIFLPFIAKVLYMFEPNRPSSGVQGLKCGPYKATATAAGAVQVATELQPCASSVPHFRWSILSFSDVWQFMRPHVQWPEFLATDPEFRVRFLALPDFLRSSGSGTGSTQPREYN